MRYSYSPSISPEADDGTYLVLNDFGAGLGRAWPEADEDRTNRDRCPRPTRWTAFPILFE